MADPDPRRPFDGLRQPPSTAYFSTDAAARRVDYFTPDTDPHRVSSFGLHSDPVRASVTYLPYDEGPRLVGPVTVGPGARMYFDFDSEGQGRTWTVHSPAQEPTDEERIAHGRSRAYARIDATLAQHEGMLRGYAAHLLGGWAEARDLLQSALLTTLERWASLGPEGDPYPFLVGVIRLRAAQWTRNRGRRRQSSLDDRLERDPEAAPVVREPSAHDRALEGERALALGAAIGRLGEATHDAVRTVDLEGKTAADAASELGRRPDAVQKAHVRGLKALASDPKLKRVVLGDDHAPS